MNVLRKWWRAVVNFVADSAEALVHDDRADHERHMREFTQDQKRYLDWLNYRPP